MTSLRTSLRGLASGVGPAARVSAARLEASTPPSLATTTRRTFHATRPALVKAGDAIPDLEVLVEGSPGNKVSLAAELAKAGTGKGLIIGVPAAFSGACSVKHVPSFINHPKLKDVGPVFVVAVNDAFVMKAWADTMDPAKETGVR